MGLCFRLQGLGFRYLSSHSPSEKHGKRVRWGEEGADKVGGGGGREGGIERIRGCIGKRKRRRKGGNT